VVASGDRNNIIAYLKEAHKVSITKACKATGFNKSMFYYKSVKDDSLVIAKLTELSEQKPNRGFPNYFNRIRNEGIVWNKKRVKRVYNKMNLNLRRKRKRRLPTRIKQPLFAPLESNKSWSMDFMHDCLMSGRKVRVLNIIDDYNRQALSIDVDYSHSGGSVKRAIQRIIDEQGKPDEIRCDNGPEFLSHELADYCKATGIILKYIQPGKPTQNAYIERFNRSYREDVLDAYLFEEIEQLRNLSWKWLLDYNQNHPHQSLKNMSPLNFIKQNQHI
jgi:putative transposase